MNLKKKSLSGQRSQAMVEFALVIPLLMLVLMGVFDLGRGIYAYNVVASAAREGARLGIVSPSNATCPPANSNICSQAKANTAALDPTAIKVTSQCVSNPSAPDPSHPCTQGNFMRVTVTYPFQPVMAFFATITVTGKSTMTIE